MQGCPGCSEEIQGEKVMPDLKLHYVMFFNENIRDILTDKLTVLFNRTINNCKAHLTLCLPQIYDVNKISHYREAYDEVSIQRFLSENRAFWNSRNLLRYIHYTTNMDLDRSKSVLISQGLVFPGLNSDEIKWEGLDVLYCREAKLENVSASQYSIMEFLNNLGYEVDTEEEQCYDFSCCYFSPRCRKSLYLKLSDILEKYQQADQANRMDVVRYLSQDETNILLTLLVSQIKEELDDFNIQSLDQEPMYIDPKMVEHFYSVT